MTPNQVAIYGEGPFWFVFVAVFRGGKGRHTTPSGGTPCSGEADATLCPMHTDSDEDSGAGDDSGWSDLEDFIVCKPDRDYSKLFDRRFGYKGGSSRVALEEGA